MTYENLEKDDKIKRTVKHLGDKFGHGKFKIKDFWEADLCAIGLTDIEEKHLIYISTCSGEGYFVSLENLSVMDDYPYERAGDFDNLDLDGLEKIFAKHLRL
jgi:hypothetical protein